MDNVLKESASGDLDDESVDIPNHNGQINWIVKTEKP